jgi:uncharacterized protein (DUF983 family)
MGALRGIVIWAAVAVLSAVAAGFLAGAKNRNPSMWAAWSFVFPPTVIVLLLLARNRGERVRTSSFDDDDRRIEAP